MTDKKNHDERVDPEFPGRDLAVIIRDNEKEVVRFMYGGVRKEIRADNSVMLEDMI